MESDDRPAIARQFVGAIVSVGNNEVSAISQTDVVFYIIYIIRI